MRRWRNGLKRLFYFCGSLALAARDRVAGSFGIRRGRAPAVSCVVLCYHSVPSGSARRFRRQVDLLRRRCRVLPADYRGTLDPGHRYAVITFDDGFESVAAHALPVLERCGLPATLFVPAGWIGKRPGWIDEDGHPDRFETVMGAEALRSVSSLRVAIGSHSMTHGYLDRIGPEAARRELADSKAELERITGSKVAMLAFPHGVYTDRLLQQAREAGYARVFTLEPQPAFSRPDEFVTGRIDVGPHLTDWEFELVLTAAYSWIPAYRRLKGRVRAWAGALGRRSLRPEPRWEDQT